MLLSIAPAPIVVTPVLSIVTSPLIATAAAMFDALPTMIFALVNADPRGDVPV